MGINKVGKVGINKIQMRLSLEGNAKNLEGYICDFYAAGATSEIIKRIIKSFIF